LLPKSSETAPQVLGSQPEFEPAVASGLLLLSRSYCHLCDDMLVALQAEGFTPTVIDVDANEAYLAQWDEKVPVLLLNGHYICHYHLDVGALRGAVS
jgi:glutaredoxin